MFDVRGTFLHVNSVSRTFYLVCLSLSRMRGSTDVAVVVDKSSKILKRKPVRESVIITSGGN